MPTDNIAYSSGKLEHVGVWRSRNWHGVRTRAYSLLERVLPHVVLFIVQSV